MESRTSRISCCFEFLGTGSMLSCGGATWMRPLDVGIGNREGEYPERHVESGNWDAIFVRRVVFFFFLFGSCAVS